MSSTATPDPSLSSGSITTRYTSLPSSQSIPAFQFHLTRMVDTLFIWVSAGEQSESAQHPAGQFDAADEREGDAPAPPATDRRLASDWAVAMPSRGHIPITATSIYKFGAGDLALSMSQRLDVDVQLISVFIHLSPVTSSITFRRAARRFPKQQVHLSLSLPPSLTAQTGPSSDPYASRHLLMMEKRLGAWLDEVLAAEKAQ